MTNQEIINQQNDYCNITKWHSSGITGKGVVIMNCEGNGTHGQQTRQRILDSAPDATVINASISTLSKSGKIYKYQVYYNNQYYSLEDFIVKNNVKILTQSNHGRTEENTWYSQELNKLKDKYNLIFFNLAGNKGNTCNGAFPSDVAIWVGASSLVDGNPQYVKSFCNGETKAFTDFMGWNWGTSFSCPYLAGKCALLVQKYGMWITQEHVFQYFKTHVQDLETIGKDIYTGWGIVIMGDIKKEIKLTVGNKTMLVDGMEVELDQAPIQTNDTYRMLVPIRAITESLGADVEWDEKTRTATFVL